MLQAYVDDSVKHVDQNGKRERHVLFLAGYVQSAEKWAAFSHDWAEELARHPKIEYLHMVEAAGLRGEFHGVTEDERNRRLTRFAEIVSRSKPWSFDVAIDIKEYHEIMVDSVMYPWQSPYLVAYIGVVMLVSGLLERANHSSSVDFYFDDIEVMKRASDFVYLKLKEGMRPGIAKYMGIIPSFCNDKEIAAMQAADMLAWHVQKEHGRETTAKVLPISDIVFPDERHFHLKVDSGAIGRMKDFLQSLPKVEGDERKKLWKTFLKTVDSSG